MVFRFLIPVVAALLMTPFMVQAQMSQLGGPANFPPVGFTGQQFVDNDGCVYLRAGIGGAVNWVPRVKANRRPLCDLLPTFGAAALEIGMVAAAQAGVPTVWVAAPASAAASAPAPLAVAATVAPPVFARPAPTYQASGTPAQCAPGSPQLETVLLRSGRTALVCTKGDGTLTGWRSPAFPQGVNGGALTPQMMRGATLAAPLIAANAIPAPPKGYRLAWIDDRLNPMRGHGTAAGQAQQDQVWTRDIPARLVTAAPLQANTTSVSTMSALAAYVQVGTFGQPANADGARSRLTAIGLPVSTGKITSKGRVLQVVYAGPFTTFAQAQAALTSARHAGFAEAILK